MSFALPCLVGLTLLLCGSVAALADLAQGSSGLLPIPAFTGEPRGFTLRLSPGLDGNLRALVAGGRARSLADLARAAAGLVEGGAP
jgi:hypothetical protein